MCNVSGKSNGTHTEETIARKGKWQMEKSAHNIHIVLEETNDVDMNMVKKRRMQWLKTHPTITTTHDPADYGYRGRNRKQWTDHLELSEGLHRSLALRHPEDIETDCLRQGPTLTDSDNITNLDTEGRRGVGSQVFVPLLVTVVLGHVVEVISPDDDRPRHLR
jgi:hypothetical protein